MTDEDMNACIFCTLMEKEIERKRIRNQNKEE